MRCRGVVVAMVVLCLLGVMVGCQTPADATLCAGQPAREVVVSSQAAQSLSEKVDAATSDGKQFRLQVTEQEVSSYLALQVSGGPVSQAVVWFTPQKAYLQGQVDMAGKHQMKGAFSLEVREGKLALRLLCATLDDVAMPGLALNTLQQALNATLSEYASPYRWDEAQIGDGTVLLVGQKP